MGVPEWLHQVDAGDWISLAGVLIAGCSAIGATVSACRARDAKADAERARARAEEDARRAIAAAEKAAIAQGESAAAAQRAADALEMHNQLTATRDVEHSKSQARNVVVTAGTRNGRRGLVVRNDSDEPIYKLHVDLPGGGWRLLRAWTRGVDPVPDSVFREVLLGGDSTIADSLFVLETSAGEAADEQAFVRILRVRFRDARSVWWERIGNADPVEIAPLD